MSFDVIRLWTNRWYRMKVRFLLYSHDGLGLGHTRRHMAVATALARVHPEAAILLVTGTDEIVRHGLAREIDVLKTAGFAEGCERKVFCATSASCRRGDSLVEIGFASGRSE